MPDARCPMPDASHTRTDVVNPPVAGNIRSFPLGRQRFTALWSAVLGLPPKQDLRESRHCDWLRDVK